MTTHRNEDDAYVLGSDPHEVERLDRQAAVIEPATRLLLRLAGLSAGMRVLDLGSGLGHVTRLAGEFVGETGAVVGLERAADMVRVAGERVRNAGASNVSFVHADVSTWRGDAPFDAIVGRLILFHLPRPVDMVRHHLSNLRPGGTFVVVDFDAGGTRADPVVPIVQDAVGWVLRAFAAAGASPRIGVRLRPILEQAGCEHVTTLGVQGYLAPDDPAGPAMLAGVVRSLAPVVIAHGIATSAQLGLDTLEQRIAEGLRSEGAVLLPPTVVGAWGRAPAA